MTKHTRTPWPQNDKPITDLFRAIACVNAFHSGDGREIPTEKIEPGLVWEMRDFIANMAEGGNFEARALLAKLED